ncbi:unnamed protein product, partial [Discosporangium mesarthrocarpum]
MVGSGSLLNVNERGVWGNTPLIVAAQYGRTEVGLALLSHGADPCLTNERGASPLLFACAEGLERLC